MSESANVLIVVLTNRETGELVHEHAEGICTKSDAVEIVSEQRGRVGNHIAVSHRWASSIVDGEWV